MSEKRRDQRGRILKTGESHRKDGLYMFRYTDTRKQRRYIYARSLEELRRKEAEIQRDLADGIDYAAGAMTVLELVTRYMDLKRTLKENSYRAYDTVINRMRKDPFSQKQIRQIKPSDAKAWFVSLHDRGYKQSTISTVQCVVRPAFEMAVDDDMIRKNPFKFKLSDVIPKDAFVRTALTREQQDLYLQFFQEYGGGSYYDDIVILLGTGLRVSELYGLTKADLDFTRRCLYVRRQLCRTANRPYFITSPKTKSGIRTIPMTDMVYMALKRVLKDRTPRWWTGAAASCSWIRTAGQRWPCIWRTTCVFSSGNTGGPWGRTFPWSRPMCCGIPSVRICSGRASTSRVCSTSWDTPAPASPWMSTPTRTTTPSSTPLIRSQPTCDRIKTGHFPYTASYTICVETYPYLCRFTGDPNFGRAPQNPAKSLRQKGYGGLYTSAWAASKSPGRAGGMY